MNAFKITVQKLQALLNENKPVFILDVRPGEQREEWHIPESTHKDIYDELKKGNESVLDAISFPENALIVTVCEAGKTSLIASEALNKKGISALSLEGGMKAWNTAEISLQSPDLTIIQVRRTAKGCLSYVAGSQDEAIVVDAALEPKIYLDVAQSRGWKIRYVMDTHVHADYLSRTRELATASGAEHLFIKGAKVDYPFEPVIEGQRLKFGNSQIEILHTPGHTPESTSYLVNNRLLLTGDTLFTDGVGRPDLKANKQEALRKASQLYDSLQRIMQLPRETMVLPAHISHAVPFDGKMIMEDLATLKAKSELLNLHQEQFLEATLQRIPPTPPNYMIIAQLNKKGSFEGYQPAELEAGANRCAVA